MRVRAYRVERDGDDSCFARAQLTLIFSYRVTGDGNATRTDTSARLTG